MKLLVTHAHSTIEVHASPHLGRLIQPRHYPRIADTAMAGITWAADNDAFNGWDPVVANRYDRMLDAVKGLPGCRFVCVPDVVADPRATARMWSRWQSAPRRRGLPVGFVGQDGCVELGLVPRAWEFDAVFIGGSTEWKLGAEAEWLTRWAKRKGKWVHMGRVNSACRLRYAASIGCDSVDGTKWVLWLNVHLATGVELAGAPVQMRMVMA